jgi:hypothetical protein
MLTNNVIIPMHLYIKEGTENAWNDPKKYRAGR